MQAVWGKCQAEPAARHKLATACIQRSLTPYIQLFVPHSYDTNTASMLRMCRPTVSEQASFEKDAFSKINRSQQRGVQGVRIGRYSRLVLVCQHDVSNGPASAPLSVCANRHLNVLPNPRQIPGLLLQRLHVLCYSMCICLMHAGPFVSNVCIHKLRPCCQLYARLA